MSNGPYGGMADRWRKLSEDRPGGVVICLSLFGREFAVTSYDGKKVDNPIDMEVAEYFPDSEDKVDGTYKDVSLTLSTIEYAAIEAAVGYIIADDY